MVQYAERAIAGWKNGEHRDIARDMNRLTLEIVVKTLFNSDVSNDADCATVETTTDEVEVGAAALNRKGLA